MKLTNVKAIKGQPRAIVQIEKVAEIAASNLPNAPVLFCGPSGVGKDHLINAFLKDLQEEGWDAVLHVKDCDQIQLQSDAVNIINPLTDTMSLVDALNMSQVCKVVVVLNEGQKLFKGSANKSAMERDLCKFIFPHGDAVQSSITGEIGKREVTCNFRNLLLIVATNEKESMETTASLKMGQTPFARRFRIVELSTYSQEIIADIIPDVFLAKLNVKIGSCASGLVSRLHRGTMTAVSDVCKQLEGIDKKTVNKEEILAACRLTEYLPRGLKRSEGRLLRECSTGALSGGACLSVLGGTASLFQASFLHLHSQRTDIKGESEHTPLLAKVSGGYRTTPFGVRYLAGVLSDGFTID